MAKQKVRNYTSSIQQTLLKNTSELKQQNTKYLGLMLEHAYKKDYIWQNVSKIGDYYAMDFEIANNQLFNVLSKTISDAKTNGISKLIWSNESLLGKENYIINALKKISEDISINLKIIVYVSNYIKWSQSAYKQWGIKHKTYEGPIQSYCEWMGNRAPYFYTMLEPLYHEFPNSTFIRNMDAVGNVVGDFFEVCGIDVTNVTFIRYNEAPKIEELYLRNIYNSQFDTAVLPDEYDKTIGKLTQLEQTVDNVIFDMLPIKSDLRQINEITSDDQIQMNLLLKAQGQMLLDNSIPGNMKSEKIDLTKLVNGLSELIIKQSIKIKSLEKDIKNLASSNK